MHQTITYRGHTLSWQAHSPGEHTYLFIHGYSANRAIWQRELALFAPRGRCVTLDLPGHYPAQVPPSYLSLDQATLLDLELHAIAQIAAGRPCTLIGHSTGGLLALAAAAELGEQVAGVIAIAPVVWGPLHGALGLSQRLFHKPGGYAAYWLNYRLTQLSLRYIQLGIGMAYSGDWRAYRRNPVAAAIVRAWHPAYQRSQIRNLAILLQALEHVDIRPLLPQIRCPSLLICGRRDPVVPAEQSRFLAAHLPKATLLEIAQAGHLPHWEAAEQVDRAINTWLDR